MLLNARKICVFLKNNYIITNTQFNKFLFSILTVKQLKLQYRLFKLDFISFIDPLQNIFLMHSALPQKCPYLELFWFAFFRSFPHLLWIQRDTEYHSVFSPNAGKHGKNAEQNNSEYGHFLRSFTCNSASCIVRSMFLKIILHLLYFWPHGSIVAKGICLPSS